MRRHMRHICKSATSSRTVRFFERLLLFEVVLLLILCASFSTQNRNIFTFIQNHFSNRTQNARQADENSNGYINSADSSRGLLQNIHNFAWSPTANRETTPEEDKEAEISQIYQKLRYDTSPEWIDQYSLHKNLLTIPYGPNRGEVWNTIDDIEFYDSDPRLIWTVYLNHILNFDSSSPFSSPANINIPFSWYDWIDTHEINKLISLKHSKPTCDFLFEGALHRDSLQFIEWELKENLFDNDRSKYNSDKWYIYARQFGNQNIFKNLEDYCIPDDSEHKFSTGLIVRRTETRCRPEVFQLQARNYIISSLDNPISITMISNIGGDTYQFYLNNASENIIQSNLLKEFLDSEVGPMPDDSSYFLQHNVNFDYLSKLNEFKTNENVCNTFKLDIKETNKELLNDIEIHLDANDFEFNATEKIQELENLPSEELTPHFKSYLESIKFSDNTNPAFCPKYFYEGTGIQEYKGKGMHRDLRFFNGDSSLFDDQEYFNRMNSMIRTFQKFTLSNGIISWLSHGTLYGYLYNSAAFPWDDDFDLQLPIKHLHYLAQYFNQSLVIEDPSEGNGRYLLDMSSSLTTRVNGNGANNIDGRFIDIDSGIYIDLTGLSISSAITNKKIKEFMMNEIRSKKIDMENIQEINILSNSEDFGHMNLSDLLKYSETHPNTFSSHELNAIEKLYDKECAILNKTSTFERKLTSQQRYALHKKLGIYNCRNNHFSPLSYLSPLRVSQFHGVPALIPNKYITLLRNEYRLPTKLGYINYKKFTFLPGVMSWLKRNFVEKCSNVNSWYNGMDKLPQTNKINELEFMDIRTFLANTLNYEVDGMTTFANLYSTFDVSAYRMKELEIQYDKTLNATEKKDFLVQWKNTAFDNIRNPGKDPLLYSYEKRKYQDLVATADAASVKRIERNININYIRNYWHSLRSLKLRVSDLFRSALEDSNELDLNVVGRTDLLPDNSRNSAILFKADPE